MAEAIQQWAGKEWKARLVSVKFGEIVEGQGRFPVVPCDVVLEISSADKWPVSIFALQLDVQGGGTALSIFALQINVQGGGTALRSGQWPNLHVTELQELGETTQYWIPAGQWKPIEANFRIGAKPGVPLREGKETDADVFQRERCGFWINVNGMTFALSHDGRVAEIVPGIE